MSVGIANNKDKVSEVKTTFNKLRVNTKLLL